MSEYIVVHINNGENLYYLPNIKDEEIKKDDYVIIKFEKDKSMYEDSAIVVGFADRKVVDSSSDIDSVEILRIATPHDNQMIETHKKASKEAVAEAIELSSRHDLDMKIIEAKISHDNRVLTLVFTAEERVDFRGLLKDLAKTFKRQIRLRQIGPRDHARVLNYYGKCGRKQCCSSHLPVLGGITMEMARVQDITSKGASKISGNCGKLLCCLSYELEVYKELRKALPRIGSKVTTPDGPGVVRDLEVLKQMVKVVHDQKVESNNGYEYYPVDKIKN